MAYEISWHQARRIIDLRITGDLTVEEVRKFSNELITHLDDGIAPVHIIADITHIRKFPSNITAMKNAVPHVKHSNLGWNVIVGGPYLLEAIAQIIARVVAVRYRVAHTVEEALEFLRVQDASLEPEPR